MKKKKSRLEWLSRELLVAPYHYALALDEGAFHSELKRLGVPKRSWPEFQKHARSHATSYYFEETKSVGQCAIVCMHPAKKSSHDTKQVYALLVHEAVHIWQVCKDSLGEACPGVEEEAYAVQRISQSLMFSYDEQMKVRRGKR